MNQIDAKLRITADGSQARKELADTAKGAVDLGKATQSAGASGGTPFGVVRRGVQSISDQLALAKSLFLQFVGAQAGLQSARALVDLADGYSSMVARLRVATQGQLEFVTALGSARTMAAQYQLPLRETASLYTRLLGALRPLGGGLTEANVATEALLASLKISGATVAESGSAILQFSQALGRGALQGEEFNAIAEAAPRLLDALAQGMGKPRDQLKALAEQGALTTSAIVTALRKSLPQLRAEAAQIPATIGGALQGVQDKWLEFVGKGADQSVGVRMIVDALRSLGDNLDKIVPALTLAGAAFLAMKLGAAVAGFVSMAAGAATAAGALPALAGGLRVLLGLIGGPVGLVVALGSLALAWLAVDKAKAKTTPRATEEIEKDIAAARKEIDDLAALRKKTERGTFAGDVSQNSRELLARQRLTKLEQEAQAAELAAQGAARKAFRDTELGSTQEISLRDPQTIAKFEKDYETRAAIVKRFADGRRDYILAKDKDIAAAQKAGNADLERKLLTQKADSLKVQAKEEEDALRKFAKDETLTRLATYKEHYDRIADLAADATARELALNQSLYDQNLRDAQTYFSERERLERQGSDQAIARLQRELVERQRVLRTNEGVLKRASSVNEREGATEAVAQARSDLERTRAELEKAQREAADKDRQRGVDQTGISRELADQVAANDLLIKQARDQVTLADLRLQLERQYAAQRVKEFTETGDTAQTDALIAAQLRAAEFARQRERLTAITERLRLVEADIDAQVQRGTLTALEGEAAKLRARGAEIEQLERILAALQAIAQTPADAAAIEAIRQQLVGLKDTTTELERSVRGSIGSGFATMFSEISTGSKKAGDAFRDFLAGVARAALNTIGQELGQKLARSLMGTGKDGGLISKGIGWLAGLFHSGGVVGSRGGMARAVSPLVFAGAQVLHAGGLAGLASNEVPAILQRGEEVLTADDPRHQRNWRGGGATIGSVNVSVSVDGASGGASQADGRALGSALEAAVIDVLERESRPGGILARR